MASSTACWLFVPVLVWPTIASGYRPFNSTDGAVADRGQLELEVGPLGLVFQDSEDALVAPSLVVNWGFAEGWEAVIEGRHFIQLGSTIAEPRQRVDDAALSVKHVLRAGSLQERAGPSVAIEAGLLLPTINGEAGSGAEATLIVSQRWDALTVHLNGAASLTRAHRLGLFGGAVAEFHDAWPVRPVAEAFVETEEGEPATLSGLLGVIGRVSTSLSFDAALRLAAAGPLTTTEVRAGLTWAFDVGVP